MSTYSISASFNNTTLNEPAVVAGQASTLTLSLSNGAKKAPIQAATPSQNPEASGPLIFTLDLSALFTEPADQSTCQVTADGWTCTFFPATQTLPAVWSMACNTTTEWLKDDPLTFQITGIKATAAPRSYDLKLYYPCGFELGDCYVPVAVQAATPGADLNGAVSFSLTNPAYPKNVLPPVLVTKVADIPLTSELDLTMTLKTPGTPLVAKGQPNTASFTISVPHADNPPGRGAMSSTTQAGQFTLSADPTVFNPPVNQQNCSWTFTPCSAEILSSATATSVTFKIGNIVSQYFPGLSYVQLSWHGVPGYADGTVQFPVSRIYPPMLLSGFTITALTGGGTIAGSGTAATIPGGYLAPPQGGGPTTAVTLSWNVQNASMLVLFGYGALPLVPAQGSVTIPVERSTTFVLTAYDMQLVNIQTAVCTVTTSVPLAAGCVPAGAIAAWNGAVTAIPAGWSLCNGQNGTPDLRDRFILGAYGTENPGDSGPGSPHVHSIGALNPQTPFSFTTTDAGGHDHGLPQNWYAINLSCGKYAGVGNGGNFSNFAPVPDHNHTLLLSFPGIYTDATTTARPPWYALCYIMYTAIA